MSCLYYCALAFILGSLITFLFCRHTVILQEIAGIRADINRLMAAFAETQSKT